MASYHVPRKVGDDPALTQRTVQACVCNACEGLGWEERQGCAVLGPLLYGFTEWLVTELSRDEMHDVYFMAREGLIMKRAFDLLHIPEIKTHYLLCSRRSYVFPLLWQCRDMEEMLLYAADNGTVTMRGLLLQLGLDPERYRQAALDHRVDLDAKFSRNDFIGYEPNCKLFEKIKSGAAESSKQEFDALVTYFKKIKLGSRVALVDIGYRGTMQNALIGLLRAAGISADVKGYYVGIEPKGSRFISGRLVGEGYLFDMHHGEDISLEIRSVMTSLFEAQFLTAHGSVEKFVMRNGHAVPCLFKFEYETDETMRVDEKAFMEKYINGGLAFLRYMQAVFHGKLLPLAPNVAYRPIRRLGFEPTLREAKHWGDFRFINYGKVLYLAKPQKLYVYLLHPHRFASDIRRSETWKAGFLKRLFLLPLPYGIMYKKFRQFAKSLQTHSS